jgi:hypothetical protein
MANLQIAQTILSQLRGLGAIKMMSWGANKFVGGANFLEFKVQGFILKGRVRITLTSMDDYTITFYKPRGTEPFKTIEGIFFDEMVDVIDRNVEFTGADYEKRVNEAKYKF